jgi:general secretion pathway protein L
MAISDTFHSLRVSALGTQLSLHGLLERWRDSLLVCAPEIVRRQLVHQDQRLVIVPRTGTAELFEEQGKEQHLIGEIDPLASGALQAMLAGVQRTQHLTVIRLAEPQVLRRTVSFPAQVRDNLAQVVRYEIDRLSPFQSDQVFSDFRLLGPAAGPAKIAVELALCKRDEVRGWLQRLRDAGAPADALTWEGAWPKANLLPKDERPSRRGRLLTLTNVLLLLVLLLGAAALATPLWQKHQLRTALTAQVQELKGKAEEVYKARDALERARKGSVAVLQLKADQALSIDLLRELTERLPDDTWVQNLDVQDGEVQIRGESAQATALLGLLEKAPGISEVAFRSPVVQVATTGRERFHISFRYRRPKSS